ncbi:MAG TPA: PEGA domain-containing protein, partial [Kofleriaceae bacterium]|nr:PEGA domain-containing protein [Kofleriaceae bacterium]
MRAFLFLIASGCATLVNRGSESIALRSDPPGAIVAMDGLEVGPTPTTVRARIQTGARFDFRWADGATATCTITTHAQPLWYVPDVLGGVVGIFVDLASGAAVGLDAH